jgi:hypothetical protein
MAPWMGEESASRRASYIKPFENPFKTRSKPFRSLLDPSKPLKPLKYSFNRGLM